MEVVAGEVAEVAEEDVGALVVLDLVRKKTSRRVGRVAGAMEYFSFSSAESGSTSNASARHWTVMSRKDKMISRKTGRVVPGFGYVPATSKLSLSASLTLPSSAEVRMKSILLAGR